MADQMLGNKEGVTNAAIATAPQRSNMGQRADTTNDPRTHSDIDDTDTIAAMRTRLAAIDAAFYTAARLNTMTVNDMVYAIRVADAPTTIKQ